MLTNLVSWNFDNLSKFRGRNSNYRNFREPQFLRKTFFVFCTPRKISRVFYSWHSLHVGWEWQWPEVDVIFVLIEMFDFRGLGNVLCDQSTIRKETSSWNRKINHTKKSSMCKLESSSSLVNSYRPTDWIVLMTKLSNYLFTVDAQLITWVLMMIKMNAPLIGQVFILTTREILYQPVYLSLVCHILIEETSWTYRERHPMTSTKNYHFHSIPYRMRKLLLP